jgi:cytochrome c556
MRWIFLLLLILTVGPTFGAPQGASESPRAPVRAGFPWFVVPKTTAGTQVLEDFERIWRDDVMREQRKERAHWQKLRAADEQRIRHRYRVETQIALQRAVAVAAAQKAFERKFPRSTGNENAAEAGGSDETPSVWRPGGEERAEEKTLGDKVEEALDAAREEAGKTLGQLDRVVDQIVIPSPGQPATPGRSGFVFFLMLLAVFLVPTVAICLLLLAFLQLRHGHRLQSAIFGLAGCAMLGLVLAARQEMRAQDPAEKRAEIARVRAMCEASAVRLDGFVSSAIPGGVVVTDVKGTRVDEYGWAVVLTEKPTARSGERWRLQVYPIGVRKAENALGLVRALPAYADSLDAAVTLRAEAESEAAQWWWQRMLRSIREA